MKAPSSVKAVSQAFDAYVESHPDFPWSNCDAAVKKTVAIAKGLGIVAHPVHFDPSRLDEVEWEDMNPNHTWVIIDDWFYDPKHNTMHRIKSKHPYQPHELITLVE